MPFLSPSIGRVLGHYRILEQIGAGGMGIVYRAKDLQLDRDVALKFLPGVALKDSGGRTRFRKEALALARLNHPNVATVHEFATENGVDFLVTEYIAGLTLDTKLTAGPLSQPETLNLGLQLVQGLEAAHEQGIVHRDLKPGNLRLTSKGQLKILDFGLAKLSARPIAGVLNETLTREQSFSGTLPYMSPEQVRGHAADERSDIWAVGAVFYEMVTGQRPFPERHPPQLVDDILHQLPQPPTSMNAGITPGLEAIILKALDKNPDLRYQSARELRVDLQRLQTPSSGIPFLVSVHRRRRPKAITSIAILPLANTTADPQTEYVSDGISENIINALSHLPRLRVMARTTVFRYKGSEVDPITIGRELNVGAVLTGRLVQRGDTLNISVELVDVSDGAQIWGDQYCYRLSNMLMVQGEIAIEISSRLRLKLTGREKKQIAKHHTENREAYQAYLRGRYMASKYTKEGMKKAIQYFRQAIELDSAFALAYAGLAMSYWNVSAVQFAPNEVMPKAREAARRALEIDPQLAESHAAVALVKMAYEWDRAAAEREFRLATELNPGYATMYQWHGWHLAIMGRLEESIAEFERAVDIDPLSEINTYIGLSYYWGRQYELAVEQFQRALDLDPDFWLPHLYLGWTHLQQDHVARANEELAHAFQLEDNPWTLASLGHASAISGNYAQAHRILSELEQRAAVQFVTPYFVGRIFTSLGEREQAFKWLEKAYDVRDECLTWLRVDPTMDSLRSDQRCADLLRRLHLHS